MLIIFIMLIILLTMVSRKDTYTKKNLENFFNAGRYIKKVEANGIEGFTTKYSNFNEYFETK